MQEKKLFASGAQSSPEVTVNPNAAKVQQNEVLYANQKKRIDKFNELKANFAKITNRGGHHEPGYRANYESTSYLITIEGVDEIALEDTIFVKPELKSLEQTEKQYFVQYHMTFHNPNHKSNMGFFGRTYKS